MCVFLEMCPFVNNVIYVFLSMHQTTVLLDYISIIRLLSILPTDRQVLHLKIQCYTWDYIFNKNVPTSHLSYVCRSVSYICLYVYMFKSLATRTHIRPICFVRYATKRGRELREIKRKIGQVKTIVQEYSHIWEFMTLHAHKYIYTSKSIIMYA